MPFSNFHKAVLFLLFIVSLSSCKTVQTPQKQAIAKVIPPTFVEFSIQKITAVNLEESLTGDDELMLAYNLIIQDSTGKALAAQNSVWGVTKAKKGQVFEADTFEKISLEIPKTGKAMASLALIEVENYDKAKKIIDDINKLGGLAGTAAALIELGAYETPFAVVLATLKAAGLSIKAIDYLDNDDLLGSHTLTFTHEQVLKNVKTISVPLVFKGKNITDTFEYHLEVSVSKK
jgi:hypothetical protein